MATFLSSSSCPLPLLLSSNHCRLQTPPSLSLSFPFSYPLRATFTANSRQIKTLILASSNTDSSFDGFGFNREPRSTDKKSLLSELIQEIEPLDVSLIQKDVPPATLDAMKRTISGMLGLLPSDRFQVFIEAWWESLSKLLVSSMMTGYTLRNAEYRLCLERNLDIHEEDSEKQAQGNSKNNLQALVLESEETNQSLGKDTEFEKIAEDLSDDINIQGLGEISLEAQQYILHLQSHLSSVKKELHEVRMKSAALQMQQFVGEEKNDLLDYLRSLQPEKVAELSEPTFPELKETIHSVVHGLLATLSPKMHSKTPPQSENTSPGSLNIGVDCAELVENTSLHFQPLISLSRDYLARLLFWCMLLGHYLRGLEYRMELTELLSLTSHEENDSCEDRQVA
ncbi:uncharacterized protein [Populus alba]|uniref:MAR-binding filament-like protein 1 n=2 Tax=Populus TaxID=3689 RepID=A0A4U5QCH0_POPAL|nr:uncharacterized protein LOC118055462 [Populus alba]KAJ7013423.1 hypothetical protein NC653_003183 [Populus alba x Populus x berolinensis]TKS08148.1 hypothetical protein D5086_0000107980 [Populus alba]